MKSTAEDICSPCWRPAALLASSCCPPPLRLRQRGEGLHHHPGHLRTCNNGNIWGYSYEDNAETDNNGNGDRLYTYIQQVGPENPNTFLVIRRRHPGSPSLTDDLYNKTPGGAPSGRHRHELHGL